MRISTILISLILLSPAYASEDTPRFGITLRSVSGSTCAIFQGNGLRPDQDMLIAVFNPPRWINAKLTNINASQCSARNIQQTVAYDIQLEQIENHDFTPGIAVITRTMKPVIKNGSPGLSDNKAEQFLDLRSCLSNEGIHFSAWRGDSQVWHEYYYLGYDVDPTCPGDEAVN